MDQGEKILYQTLMTVPLTVPNDPTKRQRLRTNATLQPPKDRTISMRAVPDSKL